jgi:2-oxoacid:acceptor oxidoreductase delta subunit (pyruvate/2-ketoisovalerate family)
MPVNWKKAKDLPPGPICTITVDEINKTGAWRTVRPVIDSEKCNGCFTCWKFCPEACIQIKGDKVNIDYDFCKGCGICENECPKKAISMQMEE